MSAQIEQKIWKLETENQELKDRLEELEKKFEKNQKTEIHDLKEITNWIKEFHEKISDILNRKDWIDKIIDKIKKILHI